MIGKEVLNYTIKSFIGKGGMGSVYLAENKYIKEQKVAIKVINGDRVNDFMRSQLAEEAKKLAKLNHPNIVHFLNFDIDDKGNVYLIMEYAEGISLDKYIQTVSGLIVEDRVCPIIEPILDAVQYAHSQGIIHRDIKPANIMISSDGVPKILDFGIAKMMGDAEADNIIMGTPSYMSPEQVKGEPLDERTDIYSLGVLLHHMLTGNGPYDTTTMTEYEINKKVVDEPLPRMKTFYKFINDKVQKVVDKATAKNKKDRFQSCNDFKNALHKAIYPPKVGGGVKAFVFILLALILGGGYFYWDYTRTKIYFYKDYAEQFGIPVGVGKISSEQAKHMTRMYRFEYSQRTLRRVSHVNSVGRIIDDSESERYDRPLDAWFYYTPDKKISKVKVKDENGKVLYVKAYNDNLKTVIFQYDDEYGMEKVIGNQTVGYVRFMSDDVDKGKISRFLIDYDENGYVTKITYAGFFNMLVGDVQGIYGKSYVRDEKGRVVEEHYIGSDGQFRATKWGLGYKKFYYDDLDNWYRAEYYTLSGEPAYDDFDGISIYEMDLDENGNVIKVYHRGPSGELMLSKKNSMSIAAYTLDDRGFMTEARYYGPDEQPIMVSGYSTVKYEVNDNGFVTKFSYYDTDGNLSSTTSGYAMTTNMVDDCGNVTALWNYDVKGNLVENRSGFCGVTIDYDTLGNAIKRVYYGTDRKPCYISNGTAGVMYEYNSYGQQTKRINLDTLLQPGKDNHGIIVGVYDFDKRGNIEKVRFYDATEENLMLCDEGVAGWNHVYDENGNEIERNYFDDKGKPCFYNKNYVKWVKTYDERGNMTSIRYYGKDDKLVTYQGGVGEDYTLDERGNVLVETTVGADGKLAKGKLIAKYKYDKFDNEIEFSVYDRDGKPANNSLGYHKRTYVYDERNQIIERRYYGKDNKLTTYDDDDYAIKKDEYDNKGNNVKTSYFNVKEKPVCCSEGWASSIREYDNYGNVIRQRFFGVDGKPTDPKVMMPEGIARYDKWNNMIYLASGDGNGNIIMNNKRGCAITKYEFDKKGNKLSESYFDQYDKPMINKKEGCHMMKITYDETGNILSEAYFDTKGAAMINDEEEYHKVTYKYDEAGRKIEVKYFGTNGQAMLVNSAHKETYKYDRSGNMTEIAYFDTKGKPADSYGLYHKVVVTYDSKGTYLTRKVYSASGVLLLDQKWNTRTEEWESVEDLGWQKDVRDMDSELPDSVDIGDNYGKLIVSSIKVTGKHSCKMICSIEKSKYELSKDMQDTYELYVYILALGVKSNLELPDNVSLTCILYDNKGREIYRYED